jgi:hypothetical protein
MAIFANGAATQATASVLSTATLVFDSDASGITSGITIGDVTVMNTGANTMFIGQSSVTATTGLRVPAGAQVTINGFGAKQSSTNFDIYAIAATSSTLTSALCGPASLSVNE